MKYCKQCGKQLTDDAVVCDSCGCAVEIINDNANGGENFSQTQNNGNCYNPNGFNQQQNNGFNPNNGNYYNPNGFNQQQNNGFNPNNGFDPNNYQPQNPSNGGGVASIVLGILGIIMAWLLAIVGHILSIIGIVLGARDVAKSKKVGGLVLSIIGEICAIISSILGVLLMS